MYSLNQLKEKLSAAGTVKWRTDCNFEQFWCFDVNAEPEAVWAYLADSSRFNRELGFSPRQQSEVDGKVLVTTTMAGFEQIWIEEPWTWVEGKTICGQRIYKKGMADVVHFVFHVEQENGLAKVYFYFGWVCKNPFWKWFIDVTQPVVKSKFGAALKKIEVYLLKNKNDFSGRALKGILKPLTLRQQQRLNELVTSLKAKPLNATVIDKLVDHVVNGDDLELESIRVLKLAKDWQIGMKEILGVCLHATRTGLLNISWNVVCPHCRGSRFSAESLGDIPTDSSCDSCQINFSTADEDTIEIVFKVSKSVREIPDVLYCASEPAKKSHIKVLQNILPGKKFTFKVPVKNSYYRARAVGIDFDVKFYVDADFPDKAVNVFAERKNGVVEVGTGSELTVQNTTARDIIFSFEEMRWNEYALRPAQVLSYANFRDLFAQEHLNSAVKLHLGEQTILFTDIVGSTKFYEKAGDAKAFSEVRTHFQEVFYEIKKNDGAVVKTIGDAVMAAFPSLVDAYNAAKDIQKRFYANREDLSIRLRISIHTGSVIAVQLNTGIDYFGRAVNFGAKIQSSADAGEIAMATEVYTKLIKNIGASGDTFSTVQKSYTLDASNPVPVTVIQVS